MAMTTTKLQQVVVLSTLLAAAALAPLTVHGAVDINLGVPCPKQCGSKANNTVCGDNHCCSGDGFCGLGGNYCGSGCQSGACFTNNRCSATSPCPNNQCCSVYGYCGFGQDYCGSGCRNGPCRDDHSCEGGKLCPSNLCCRGKDKKCGLGGNYCSINGDQGCLSGACYDQRCSSAKPCSNGYCCSVHGYCGVGRAYCGGDGSLTLLNGLVCVLS